MGSTRIKGAALKLAIGDPPVDYFADITACTLSNEEAESDVVTFEDAAKGEVRDFFLNITAIQSTDTESLWSFIWDNHGADVAYTYAPHGNAEPSADMPHFTGMVTIGPAPEIGGEAGKSNIFSFETQWKCDGKPTKITA